jgi:hypothetical protein
MSLTHAQMPLLKRLVSTVAGASLVAAGAFAIAGPAQADPLNQVTLHPGQINFSETRSGGHNLFTDDGLHVYTDDSTSVDKAAGYFDVNKSLHTVATAAEPTMDWAGTEPQAGKQVVIDSDLDGHPDSTLVGEPVYGNEWWLSNGSSDYAKANAPHTGGGFGSDWYGTLAEWDAHLPGAVATQAGYSLGSGIEGDGTISSMTFADTEYTFSETPTGATTTLHSPDLVHPDTRSAGHNKFLADGLHVYTDDASSQAKADGFFPVDVPLAGADQPQLNLTTASGTVPPGMQLVIDFNNDGSADGTLVGEPASYGDEFWLNNSSKPFVQNAAPHTGGGFGSPYYGKVSEWSTAFPNAKIVQAGYSLGSGVLGDYTITSVDVGTSRYKFANTAPTAPGISVSAASRGPAVTIPFASTDLDGDQLTYTVPTAPTHGVIGGTSPNLTYNPTDGYVGPDTFGYTVSDGVTPPVTGTITATVTATASPTLVISSPTHLTAGADFTTFSATATNPANGATIANARYNLSMTGDPGLTSAQVSLQYLDTSTDPGVWADVPLSGSTAGSGAITGFFGPSTGFEFPTGVTNDTQLRIKVALGAPSGVVSSSVKLVDLSQAPVLVLATDTDTVTVGKASTATTLALSPSPASQNSPVTATIHVAPSGATGSVQLVLTGGTGAAPGVRATGTVGAGGTATLHYTPHGGGTFTFVAKYLGDATYAASTSTAHSLVIKAVSKVTLKLSPSPATHNKVLTATVTVTTAAGTPATGTVRLVLTAGASAGTRATGTLVNGKATLHYTPKSAGSFKYRADYVGDGHYIPNNSATVSLKIK